MANRQYKVTAKPCYTVCHPEIQPPDIKHLPTPLIPLIRMYVLSRVPHHLATIMAHYLTLNHMDPESCMSANYLIVDGRGTSVYITAVFIFILVGIALFFFLFASPLPFLYDAATCIWSLLHNYVNNITYQVY